MTEGYLGIRSLELIWSLGFGLWNLNPSRPECLYDVRNRA
jgi:hypothetical protein